MSDTTARRPAPQSDLDQVRQTLNLLLEPGQVTELRVLDVSTPGYGRPHTVSAYFDDIGPTPWQGGRRWVFTVCPWNDEHRNRSAYLLQLANGALVAGCHHNGCAGKGWTELRALYEPARGTRQRGTARSSSSSASAPANAQQATGSTAEDDPRPEIDAGVLDLPAAAARRPRAD